ncbi:hypothetical protein EDB86DRAFT_1440804 [Lactarius hatsudake]|nr:hypothetical protein EDB86DRAFT_1440804 [Lactarius hatsudake]
MEPNFTFPQPSIPAGANPPSSEGVAAFYLVVNSAQGPAYHPNIPSPRRTPSPLLPPSPFLQHSSLSPAFPMPPAPAIQVVPRHSPGYHHQQAPDIPYSLPHSGVSGAAPTWIPHTRNRACAPTAYHPSLPNGDVNGVEDDSSDEEIYVDDEARRDGGMLAKSPPTPSIYSKTTPPPSEQAQTYSVLDPQLDTYDCRYPGCTAPVRSDEAARLGGFCCDTHMLMAIHNGIAIRCSRCQQRVCPEGTKYCSGQCATGGRKGGREVRRSFWRFTS